MAGLAKKADKARQRAGETVLDYNTATDEELLVAFCQKQDSRAIEVLIQRYETPLFNYLLRYLGNREAAEDVFQASFMQVYTKCNQFDISKRFKPWLYTVATNQAIDYQRRNKRNPTVSLDTAYQSESEDGSSGSLQGLLESLEPEPGLSIDLAEQAAIIRRAVSELPQGLQDTVNLVYFENLKYKDAADILGVPVGTVKSRLHAAMKKLGEKLVPQFESAEEDENYSDAEIKKSD